MTRSTPLTSSINWRNTRKAASCPAAPADIGLGNEQFKHGILAAQLIRNRYTILDVLDELGLLREAADAVTQRMTVPS